MYELKFAKSQLRGGGGKSINSNLLSPNFGRGWVKCMNSKSQFWKGLVKCRNSNLQSLMGGGGGKKNLRTNRQYSEKISPSTLKFKRQYD